MKTALTRLRMQAERLTVFDHLHLLDENDLSDRLKNRLRERLGTSSRGYGYWTWKPEVILTTLEAMEWGDCLLYVDAGCHLNVSGRDRLLEYFDIVRQVPEGVIAFQANPPSEQNSKLKYDGRPLYDQPNFRWIKGDAFEYFDAQTKRDFTHSQAIGAGIILLRKCKRVFEIVQEWQELAMDHFNLFDDSPSKAPNLDGFIEHRHDQAIWTLLCLKYDIKTLSAYEYWYPKQYCRRPEPDWEALREFPIHAKRDTSLGVFSAIGRKLRRLTGYLLGKN